jgi:hypothetical protein
MVVLYNSYVYPFVVLLSIPEAIIGAFFAMVLTMESLNIIIGIVGAYRVSREECHSGGRFHQPTESGRYSLENCLLED